jgi:hypothetical protein
MLVLVIRRPRVSSARFSLPYLRISLHQRRHAPLGRQQPRPRTEEATKSVLGHPAPPGLCRKQTAGTPLGSQGYAHNWAQPMITHVRKYQVPYLLQPTGTHTLMLFMRRGAYGCEQGGATPGKTASRIARRAGFLPRCPPGNFSTKCVKLCTCQEAEIIVPGSMASGARFMADLHVVLVNRQDAPDKAKKGLRCADPSCQACTHLVTIMIGQRGGCRRANCLQRII